ncbi:acyl-CoA dehydrogenase family protein [Halocola ammonii]
MKQTNSVLSSEFAQSDNFYESDLILRHHLKKKLSSKALESISPNLKFIGEKAAQEMDELSQLADKHPPVLEKRDKWGEDTDRILFHPSYRELVDIAARSEMFKLKWAPEARKNFSNERNLMSFAVSSIYAMSETGVYCPLCMTDGVAVLIDKHCEEQDRKRLLKAICAESEKEIKTGAMYLTEKAGGSDVGANLVSATHWKDDLYKLNGEKWFCSNANGEIAFVLARTNSEKEGTRGLSIFLVEKKLEDGSRNPMEMIRLKDKFGVKSMASAEIQLTDTVGKLVGRQFEGFRIMTDMINLSRVYNSVAALSASRRALTEAYQFLRGRVTFGKNALEHPLIRRKLLELGSLHLANFHLTWRAVEALDKSETDEEEAQLLRLLTPMTKKWSAEKGVYITRESMELMGGIGYIEDQIMPKLMRDIMVLPIWEGAGNIMILDMLRASAKSKGLEVMFREITGSFDNPKVGELLRDEVSKLKSFGEKLMTMDNEMMQINAPQFFEKLTTVFQISLLVKNTDEESKVWTAPAIDYLSETIKNVELREESVPSIEEIEKLMAWKV